MFLYLLNKYIKSDNYRDANTRSSVANLQGKTSVFINLVIFIMKFITGIMIHSIALIADAFHTLSDILSSIIIMIGFKFASKPPDKEHPFGHQRIEFITGIIVSALLIVTGIELIRGSIDKILHPTISSAGYISIIIVSITIIMKEWLARFALFLGKRINSSAIIADFWHHRTDAISSVFVIIAIVMSRFNIPAFDGYMGIIVSMMIIYSGIKILTENSNELIGKPPEQEILKQINKTAMEFREQGLLGTHDIILNYYGNKIVGSVHLEIDEQTGLLDAHTISEAFEESIEKEGIYLTAHIDPINTHNPLIREITDLINNEIEMFKNIDSAHDVRLIGSDKWLNIAFDLTVNKILDESEKTIIYEHIKKLLCDKFKEVHDIVIKFEPLFSY